MNLHDASQARGGIDARAPAGWRGRLALDYRFVDGRTSVRDRHDGPLRVLRSLYPEGPTVCHNVLMHPPSGIVGGDLLEIAIQVGEDAHALVTTPGATRFYRSTGATARQDVIARLGPRARLEWLPLESIAYPGARAVNRMRFALDAHASMIGADVLALGLPASGQAFDRGRFEQQIEVPGVWLERGIVDADDALGRRLLDSPLGWDRMGTLATMWCASGSGWTPTEREALLEAAREAIPACVPPGRAGATSPDPRIVVVRALAERVEPLAIALEAVRRAWRRQLWGLDAVSPRSWGP